MKNLLPLSGLIALTIGIALPSLAQSSVQTITSDSPLLNDAQTKNFWQQLDANNTDFKKDLISKLATQSYRNVISVPSVRVSVLSGHALEYPSIVLEYQTSFHGTSEIQGGPFGGTAVQVFGGRDAYAHRTFFGGTEDPEARQQFLDLYAKRMKTVSKDRKNLAPEFDALYAKYMPSAPFEQVKSDVINLLKEMVAKNKSKKQSEKVDFRKLKSVFSRKKATWCVGDDGLKTQMVAEMNFSDYF